MSTSPPPRDPPLGTLPGGTSPFALLSGLPYGEQRRTIDATVEADDRLPELLEALAGMRDHEPFAYAVRQMGQRGRLASKPLAATLLRLLRSLPDTGVQRLLGGLSRVHLGPPERAVLSQSVATAMRHLGLPRLAAFCLMDRWLKNEDPSSRQALGAEALRACRGAIARCRGGSPEPLLSLQDEVILRVPGTELPLLTREAEEAGVGPAWLDRRQRFALAVLEILESQPKSLSQANAEEILSRRVYTDPGHFLSELLQNAEDAGASRWTATLLETEVQVWHDGLDFDARDVVGVLSIGQTTKARGQIGFFGVGFKSVYEISERPQIYSDVFRFEVADVSIPRRLARRPAGAPQTGTLLCLPFRDPGDPACRPPVLFDRARAVPPETLLTLDHLRALEVTQGSRRYEAKREPGPRPGRERILEREGGEDAQPSVRDYLVVRRRVAFTGGHRETSRALETPILVALRLDGAGRPVPLPDDARTIYSHLPTGEHPGFRFLIHAHFDLPIDRERLDLSSPWNLWAIAQAGEALAEAASILARDATEAQDDALLVGLLEVLPRPGELNPPAWLGAWESLCRHVQDHAILPSARGGGLRPAASAVLLDPRLTQALATVELDAAGRKALCPLGPRATALALELGAQPFGAEALLALLDRHLAFHPEGRIPPAPWIAAALPEALESLAESTVDPLALRALPLLPDTDGALYLPRNIARADPVLRKLYGPVRPLLSFALETSASPRLLGLLDALDVPVLSAESLVSDLADPHRGEALIENAGLVPLLDFLAGQPDRILGPLAHLAIFPGEDGPRGPLRQMPGGPMALWRPPPGPLGQWLRTMTGKRPPLLEATLEASHTALLDRLGAPRRGLDDVLDALVAGDLDPSDGDLDALHQALDSSRAELTPRQGARMAEAPIFPTTTGERRPLRGPKPALGTADPELRALLPEAPWVRPEVVSLSFLSQLGIPLRGASDLVDTLAGDGPLPDGLPAPSDHRRLYAYLLRRGPDLDAAHRARLAEAPIWLDATGAPRPLPVLRLAPTEPTLAALWAAWPTASLIEVHSAEGVAALTLVEALGLSHALRRSDFQGLVEELRSAPTLTALSGPVLWPLLGEALNAAATRLPSSALEALGALPLFPATDGTRRPLGDWETPPFDPTRCAPATGPIAAALAHGTRPLLAEEEAHRLDPFLRALGTRPADPRTLVEALETDDALRTSAACEAVRRAFSAEREALGRAFPPGTAEAAPSGHPRLQALPVWPSRGGRLRPSAALVRPSALADALGDAGPGQTPGVDEDLLDEAVAPEARALEGTFVFRSPALLVVERLRAEAQPGAPLTRQPAFLRRPEGLGPLLALLRAALGREALQSLPVALDARGCLVARRLHQASPEEISLARGLPVELELADPLWAEQARAVDPDLAPRLVPRRLLPALAETAREVTRVEAHPRWSDPAMRERLYAWILESRDAIARDEQARGPLGQACLFPNRGGQLVSPRQLLFDPALPEVFAPERPSEELPALLVGWLQETFPLDDRQMDRLVDHLLAVHEEAVAARQGTRSVELLDLLARLLGLPEEGPLPALPRRLKLHRRIRVETMEGSWVRPRRLLAPDPEHEALMEAFLAVPPERASARYRPRRLRRLLIALGAAEDLRAEALLDLLVKGDDLREGLEAGLALARYLAQRVAAEPGLDKALCLGERRFIPDGHGALRRPAELTWPSAEAWAVLGDRPECTPHPEFFLTVPPELAQTLPFRPLEAALLGEVRQSLQSAAERDAVPEAALAWLEAGLSTRRLSPKDVRDALGPLGFLRDTQGRLRRAGDVFRVEVAGLFGARRGYWPEAHRFRRLADALGIAREPGRREIVRYLTEVTEEALQRGPDALAAAEPELLRCLPRCLARLAALGDPLPRPLALAVMDLAPPGEELQTLCFCDDDRLCLPEPRALAEAARERGVSLLVPLLRGEAAALHEALGRAGCPPLGERFTPDPLPGRLSPDLTAAHGQSVTRLENALEALDRRRRELPRAHPGVPPSRWRKEALPTEIHVVASLRLRGALAGVRLEVEVPLALEGKRLVATPAALKDLDRVAEVLTRERLLYGFADPAVVSNVAEFLETGWASTTPRVPVGAPGPEPALAPHPVPAPLPEPEPRPRPEPAPRDVEPQGPEMGKAPRRPTAPPPAPEPRRASAHEAGTNPAETPGKDDGRSLLGRFRRWLKGDDSHRVQPEPDRAATPPPASARHSGQTGGLGLRGQTRTDDDPGAAPPSHGRFFKPRDAVNTQLEGGARWLRDRDRPPAYGFAFAPSRVPLPYLYAPLVLADRFEPRSQRWLPTVLPASLGAPSEHREGLVVLEGRIPAGELQLPLPLYGRLESLEGPVRILDSRPGRLLCAATEPAEISLGVSLGGAPRFEDPGEGALKDWAAAKLPTHLVLPTVPDDELPEPVLAFAAALATSSAPPLARALEVRTFVQQHYRYDPSYLEDPELARWLSGLARGRANAHLALLHAGRDARHLGAGVCYELGVLCCELLRRVEVPAAVATGWTFDRGRLDEPDHLWAMALLPSDLGPRWLPLDASTTREGRPLHASDRPAGPWRAKAPRGAGKIPGDPRWSGQGTGPTVDTSLPLPDLLRVARHVERLTGASGLDEAALRRRCRALLDDPEKARALLELLRAG